MSMRSRLGKANAGFGVEVKEDKSLDSSITRAKANGNLNLSNRNLTEFPMKVCNFADIPCDKWWESYPLLKVDMSFNEIPTIPEEITTQEDIVMLKFASNHLQTLPRSIFSLVGLKSIDFSSNRLVSIPEEIGQCVSLVEVNFTDNQLTELPAQMSNLEHIELIGLSENKFDHVPPCLSSYPLLKKLNLSKNLIKTIPAFISTLEQLQELVLSTNKIRNIEQNSISSLKALTLLDLRENGLEEFFEVPRSTCFDSLILSYNRLNRFGNLRNAPNLTVIDIKNNKIAKLPNELVHLENLKTLDLTNNDLSDLPNRLGIMKSLVRIAIEGNPLKGIRSTVRTAGAVVLKKYLADRISVDEIESDRIEELQGNPELNPWESFIRDSVQQKLLSVRGLSLESYDDSIWSLDYLTALDFSENKFTEIPSGISRLQELKKIRFNSNQLRELCGPAICMLENLVELELRGNKLTTFLDEVDVSRIQYVLPNLTFLDLSVNSLTKFPPTLNKMSTLQNLLLSTNHLTNVDGMETQNFPYLNAFDLSDNRIAELSDQFCLDLESVQQLNLRNNELRALPTALGFHPNIKSLQLEGNPIKSIRFNVIQKGTVEVLAYLRDRHAGQDPLDLRRKEKVALEATSTVQDTYNEQEAMEISHVPQGNINYQDSRRESSSASTTTTTDSYSHQQSQQSQIGSQREEEEEKKQGVVQEVARESEADKQARLAEMERIQSEVIALQNRLDTDFSLSTSNIMKIKRNIQHLKSEFNNLKNM